MSISGVLENLIAGLIAAMIIAILSYFAIFRSVSDRVIIYLKTIINPVDSFRNVEEFSRLLLETLESYDDNFETAVLFRAVPCELTERYRAYVTGNVDTSAKNLIEKYQRAVGIIIKSDKGAHDNSVFGRTGIAEIDEATERVIDEHYLSGERAPGTTTLALHENLNEYGVILFGVNDEVCTIGEIRWIAGFLIVYSRDFKKIRGYRYNQDSHIENLRLMFDQKSMDSKNYEFTPDMSNEGRDKIHSDIRNFYRMPSGNEP